MPGLVRDALGSHHGLPIVKTGSIWVITDVNPHNRCTCRAEVEYDPFRQKTRASGYKGNMTPIILKGPWFESEIDALLALTSELRRRYRHEKGYSFRSGHHERRHRRR